MRKTIRTRSLARTWLIWNRLRYIKDPSTGKRVSRPNPETDWIIKGVPDLRIVDDEIWRATCARQDDIADKFAKAREGVCEHHRRNRLNVGRRPRTLLSGLIFCGCCGGPYSLHGPQRYACSNHVSKATCDNSRSIRQDALESRVLAGLRERMMAPEVVEGAMRAYAEETNRLNRERRFGWGAEPGRAPGCWNGFPNDKPAAGAAGLLESMVAGAGSNLYLLPEQVKMVAGTGVDHNLQSTPVKMVAGACTHLNLLFRTAA